MIPLAPSWICRQLCFISPTAFHQPGLWKADGRGRKWGTPGPCYCGEVMTLLTPGPQLTQTILWPNKTTAFNRWRVNTTSLKDNILISFKQPRKPQNTPVIKNMFCPLSWPLRQFEQSYVKSEREAEEMLIKLGEEIAWKWYLGDQARQFLNNRVGNTMKIALSK